MERSQLTYDKVTVNDNKMFIKYIKLPPLGDKFLPYLHTTYFDIQYLCLTAQSDKVNLVLYW